MKKNVSKPKYFSGDQVKNIVAEGRNKEAIEILKYFFKKRNIKIYNTICLIEKRYVDNEGKKRRNTISENEYDVNSSKIAESLLDLVDEHERSKSKRIDKKRSWKKIGLTLIATLIIVVIAILLQNRGEKNKEKVEKINIHINEVEADTNFVVMVLPFTVSLKKTNYPDDNFHVRLISKLEKEGNLEVLTLNDQKDEGRVITYSLADSIGNANEVDLLLWGEVAYLDEDKDSVGLNLKYLNFVNERQSSDFLGYDTGQTDMQFYGYKDLIESGQLLLSVENVFNWAIAHKAIKFRLWNRAFIYLDKIMESSKVQNDKDKISLLRMMASMKINSGEPDSARLVLRRAISIDMENPLVLSQIGNSFMVKENNTDSALYYLDKAIAEDPFNHIFYNNRANVYAVRKDFNTAISNIEKEIEIDSTFFIAYGNLASYYRQSGDFKSAEYYYKRAIDKVSNKKKNRFIIANYHSQLASLYLRSNRGNISNDGFISNLGKAKIELDIAARVKKTRVYFATLGEYYLRNKNYRNAIEALNAADKLYEFKDKNNLETRASILNARGGAYFELGEYKRALRDFDKAISLHVTPEKLNNRNKCIQLLEKE